MSCFPILTLPKIFTLPVQTKTDNKIQRLYTRSSLELNNPFSPLLLPWHKKRRCKHLLFNGVNDEARTRDLMRDRHAL